MFFIIVLVRDAGEVYTSQSCSEFDWYFPQLYNHWDEKKRLLNHNLTPEKNTVVKYTKLFWMKIHLFQFRIANRLLKLEHLKFVDKTTQIDRNATALVDLGPKFLRMQQNVAENFLKGGECASDHFIVKLNEKRWDWRWSKT